MPLLPPKMFPPEPDLRMLLILSVILETRKRSVGRQALRMAVPRWMLSQIESLIRLTVNKVVNRVLLQYFCSMLEVGENVTHLGAE